MQVQGYHSFVALAYGFAHFLTRVVFRQALGKLLQTAVLRNHLVKVGECGKIGGSERLKRIVECALPFLIVRYQLAQPAI